MMCTKGLAVNLFNLEVRSKFVSFGRFWWDDCTAKISWNQNFGPEINCVFEIYKSNT